MRNSIRLLRAIKKTGAALFLISLFSVFYGFATFPGNNGSSPYTNAKIVLKVWQANVALRNNEMSKARKCLSDAFYMNPQNPLLALTVAKLLDCSQSHKTALNILERAGTIKDKPELTIGKYAWEGYCAVKIGKPMYALQQTREAIKLIRQIRILPTNAILLAMVLCNYLCGEQNYTIYGTETKETDRRAYAFISRAV